MYDVYGLEAFSTARARLRHATDPPLKPCGKRAFASARPTGRGILSGLLDCAMGNQFGESGAVCGSTFRLSPFDQEIRWRWHLPAAHRACPWPRLWRQRWRPKRSARPPSPGLALLALQATPTRSILRNTAAGVYLNITRLRRLRYRKQTAPTPAAPARRGLQRTAIRHRSFRTAFPRKAS